VVPSAVKPLETVKAQVIAAWTTDERAAKLKALAADLLAKAKATGDLTKTAAEIKASVTLSKPLQRGKFSEELGTEVPSALFDVAPLEFVMGPAPAGAGIVIARLERVLPVDLVSEAANLKSAKDDLGKAMANDLLDQYQAMLKSKYEVTINEKVLASTVGVRTP
jgi:peptidyl-prolyl cis-trans isomerase D